MKKIKVVQIGIGPLGQKITRYILEREAIRIVAAVDLDPGKAGKDLGEVCGLKSMGIPIAPSLARALKAGKADAAVLTTVSDMIRITPQIEEILSFGLPVVSTCEELSYPWETSPQLAGRIDQAARARGLAVLATGVNPGYLMDSLPLVLTAVCQRVDRIRVSRLQNAAFRRLPFQKKIGAGLSLEQFEVKKLAGTLRHVGLTESMHMIASRLGWKLDRTEEVLTPVIARQKIVTEALTIPAGYASGVQQIGRGFVGGEERITLIFRASVGEPASEDTVEIEGEPRIVSRIEGGVNGDVATCAIALNALKQVLRAQPGLRTMADIPLVSYFSA